MTKHESDGTTLKTTDKMSMILQTIRDRSGAGVSELAEELDLAKSTVHRHLKSLEKNRFLVNEDGTYHIGLRFLNFGDHARVRREVYNLACPLVDELAEETGERALFMVEEHGQAVYLHRGTSEHSVHTGTRVGSHRHLHTIAGGKAILAHLPMRRVEEIIDRWGLPAMTDNTVTDREELFENLEEIRKEGVAFNDEETIDGLRGIAVPVLGSDGDVYGALAVSGPTYRIQGEKFRSEIPELLLGIANEIEINIEYNNQVSSPTG